LFNKKIIYNPDTHQLFYDAVKRIKTIDINEIYDLMDFVKTKHTYINRIDVIFNFYSVLTKNMQAESNIPSL
jgi:hypothetical protein